MRLFFEKVKIAFKRNPEYFVLTLCAIFLTLTSQPRFVHAKFIPETQPGGSIASEHGEYIFLALAMLLLFMVVWAILDLYDQKKWINRMLMCTGFSFLVFMSKPSLNIVLDNTQTKYMNIPVVAETIEKRTRRGSSWDALEIQVRLPETNELIQFEYLYDVKLKRSEIPKSVSFTFGQGYFGDPYVKDILRPR